MANLLCFHATTDPAIFTTSLVSLPADCIEGFLAPHVSEFASLSSLGTLFQTYFSFDLPIFEQIFEANLLVFVTGHVLGRLMQAWRKSY